MITDTYRIVQIADNLFAVDYLRLVPRDSLFRKRRWVEEWRRLGALPPLMGHPGIPQGQPFPSQEAAQKYIDDLRKYPLVVKSPA